MWKSEGANGSERKRERESETQTSQTHERNQKINAKTISVHNLISELYCCCCFRLRFFSFGVLLHNFCINFVLVCVRLSLNISSQQAHELLRAKFLDGNGIEIL